MAHKKIIDSVKKQGQVAIKDLDEFLRFIINESDMRTYDYNVFVHSNKDSQDNGAPLAFASFCDDYPNREWTVFHI